MSGIDLIHQVQGILRKRNGGTGNPHGWGSAVVWIGQNPSPDPLPLGTVVKATRTLGAVAPAVAGDPVVGVVVGTYLNGDGTTLVESDVPAGGTVAVMAHGPCRVLISADVGARNYAKVAGTDGSAEQVTVPGDGVFGQFLTAGDESSLNLVKCFVFPAMQPNAIPPDPPPAAGECECVVHLPSGGQLTRWSRIPYDCTITGWSIVSDISGDIQFDVWVSSYGGAPPSTDGNSIAGSALPELSSAFRATSTTLTDWTTELNEGDWIRFQVTSDVPVADVEDVVLAIHVTKTS